MSRRGSAGDTGARRHRHPHSGHTDRGSGTHRRRPFFRRLSRDPERGMIGGVCAGIARYLGAEVWVVRCIAITGLIFMQGVVFLAYWILYFLMGPPSGKDDDDHRRDNGYHDHTSPAPELGPRLSPRRSLRTVRAGLAQVELRLRRIERHVTSAQYELQKELHKLDGDN